jgi:hypothetical protein
MNKNDAAHDTEDKKDAARDKKIIRMMQRLTQS